MQITVISGFIFFSEDIEVIKMHEDYLDFFDKTYIRIFRTEIYTHI